MSSVEFATLVFESGRRFNLRLFWFLCSLDVNMLLLIISVGDLSLVW